jgi:hypothetical protein
MGGHLEDAQAELQRADGHLKLDGVALEFGKNSREAWMASA